MARNRSTPQATTPGKRRKVSALQLHAAIVQNNRDNERRIEDGLQYVMINDEPISIQDTAAIQRILGLG